MPLFVLFGILLSSYVQHIPDERVDDGKKVVCTSVIIVLLVIWVVFSAIFGGKPGAE